MAFWNSNSIGGYVNLELTTRGSNLKVVSRVRRTPKMERGIYTKKKQISLPKTNKTQYCIEIKENLEGNKFVRNRFLI